MFLPNSSARLESGCRSSRLPPGGLGELLAELVVAEGDQDRRHVAEELVEGRGLGKDRFVVVRADAVEHGVAELMIDDVGRQAGIDALARSLLAGIEIVELQRLALAVVDRRSRRSRRGARRSAGCPRSRRQCAGRDRSRSRRSRARSAASPRHSSGETAAESRLLRSSTLPVGVDELAEIGIPLRWWIESLGPAVIVDDSETGAGRAVSETRLPWHGELFVEIVGRVGRGDERVLEVNVERDAKPSSTCVLRSM